MGVPKFYRWISERYPCLSQIVKESQIPDFDNLYLDMNGIIHNCSHPNDEDVHFRISEEKMMQDIFRYIEFLFRMIKPRKVFFMAVDGVAPRAKMNQQRGRRFRSAKEAETREFEATQRGEQLPKEARFDSNCITPGTEFMDRLHQQLKYFVTWKISTDEAWQHVKVILSGHETPGEGEHKIMDFIRYQKSQPGYDPNTRHCLYGLDADLMMLGLCSHEPHFALLREEVKYIKTKSENQKKNAMRDVNPETITFHLLHLSLFRQYIDREFGILRRKLPFEYKLEAIIDDWVLMGLLVGNDFIPHIPHFHINKNSLVKLYQAYKQILPTLDGYLNENGNLNLSRFQKYLNKLAEIDIDNFNDQYADLKYFEGKTGREMYSRKGNTSAFKTISKPVIEKKDIRKMMADENVMDKLIDLEDDDIDLNHKNENGAVKTESDGEDADGEIDDEDEDEEDDSDELFNDEFKNYKRDYYITKLMYQDVDSSVLKEQACEYIRAIQWNLHYYYHGCVSWGWFYPHHYAPYISDVNNFQDIDLNFELGKPFLPFEQLLAVLPAASKQFLPKSYQRLVEDLASPLIEYYPDNFQTDLNGKLHAWEAVVLIPFIDEQRLLKAAHDCNKNLSMVEGNRNKHGPHLVFTYTPNVLPMYKSLMPGVLPDIDNNHALCEELSETVFCLAKEKIRMGLSEGVNLKLHIPGFPTLNFVPFRVKCKKERIRVFEMPSQKESMILYLFDQDDLDIKEVAQKYLGQTVFCNWPHLTEGKVVQVFNPDLKYSLDGNNKLIETTIEDRERHELHARIKHRINEYHFRLGIVFADFDIVLQINTVCNRRWKRVDGKFILEKEYNQLPIICPLQVVLKDIPVLEPTCDQVVEINAPEVRKSVSKNANRRSNQTEEQMINIWKRLEVGNVNRNLSKSDFPPLTMKTFPQPEHARVNVGDILTKESLPKPAVEIIELSEDNPQPSSSAQKSAISIKKEPKAVARNNPKIKLLESYTIQLQRLCEQRFGKPPEFFETTNGTTIKTISNNLRLPNGSIFSVPANQYHSKKDAHDSLSKKGLEHLRTKNLPNVLLTPPKFVHDSNNAEQTTPDKKIEASVLPRPPPNWLKPKQKPNNNQDRIPSIHEIPESYIQFNRQHYGLTINGPVQPYPVVQQQPVPGQPLPPQQHFRPIVQQPYPPAPMPHPMVGCPVRIPVPGHHPNVIGPALMYQQQPLVRPQFNQPHFRQSKPNHVPRHAYQDRSGHDSSHLSETSFIPLQVARQNQHQIQRNREKNLSGSFNEESS